MNWFPALTLSLVLALALPVGAQSAPKKVLKVAFNTAETSFDPVQISDLYSRTVTPHIFEGLYQYDHLARPGLAHPRQRRAHRAGARACRTVDGQHRGLGQAVPFDNRNAEREEELHHLRIERRATRHEIAHAPTEPVADLRQNEPVGDGMLPPLP